MNFTKRRISRMGIFKGDKMYNKILQNYNHLCQRPEIWFIGQIEGYRSRSQ